MIFSIYRERIEPNRVIFDFELMALRERSAPDFDCVQVLRLPHGGTRFFAEEGVGHIGAAHQWCLRPAASVLSGDYRSVIGRCTVPVQILWQDRSELN